jgi:hypothetical protein
MENLMKLSTISAAPLLGLVFVPSVYALAPVPGCQKTVDALELALSRCISQGTVKDVDGSPGTYGPGCTIDHVLAFAAAYTDVVWCAVHGDPASVKELRQVREFANDTASPASTKHLRGP